MPSKMNRRRALETLFCSSAALALNLRPASAAAAIDRDALHFLLIGDFGTTGKEQHAVAAGMRTFQRQQRLSPAAMLLLGDNFYSPAKDGFSVQSARWRTTFEDVYPAADFPMPCYAILGNHDYHDNAGGEKVQLAYAARGGTRWTMPAKWFRCEFGSPRPLVTVFALDSNLPTVSGGKHRATGMPMASLTVEEADRQLQGLDGELAKPRAALTIVIGHHPLYSNGDHGDTPPLIEHWGPVFQKHKVHAYVCGHDHDLQHLELAGQFTSHVLSGGGGANIRGLKNVDRTMPYGKPTHGFTHLEVHEGAMVFAHHAADGTLLHRFTKHQDGRVVIG